MKSRLFLLLSAIPLLMISCASKVDRYSNVYSSNPNNRDSPHYLILNDDNSYYKILRYGDDQFERFNQLEEFGSWSVRQGHLILFNSQTREKSEEFMIVSLKDHEFGLKPTLGEGRHSEGLYRPTKERDIISTVYRKEGSYWKRVLVPFSVPVMKQ